jgi:cysteine synthase B
VKDRPALAMILDAERTGKLRPGKILLDATSGNTGIAYAMLAASRGYQVRLCVPENVTPERKRLLTLYGASLVYTDPMDGSDGAIREAQRLHAEDPDRYFYADQYSNPANWRAHYDTTAPELIEQTGGRLTHFVAGLGTSGTFVGVSRRLREWRRSTGLVSVQPDSPLHGLEGLKHMATAIVPAIYDDSLASATMAVATEEAYALLTRLARQEGIIAGPSSGAALAAAIRVARTLGHGVIATIFPDGGDRYLSERFWTNNPAQATALRVSREATTAIREHAAATYPEECCGVLFGPSAGDVAEVMAFTNVTTGERARRFLIGADEYRRAEAHAAGTGQHLLGFYHSHPDHPAEPSAFDLEHAWPNLSYVIVSVRGGVVRDLRSWRLAADRSKFHEEQLRD